MIMIHFSLSSRARMHHGPGSSMSPNFRTALSLSPSNTQGAHNDVCVFLLQKES